TGTKVFDDDVRRGDQPGEGGAALWRLQIERDRTLPRVLRQEGGAHAAAIEFGIGAELARQVAAAGHLDFDHLGAQLRELIAAERAGQHVGQIQHPRPREKTRHLRPRSERRNSVLYSRTFFKDQERRACVRAGCGARVRRATDATGRDQRESRKRRRWSAMIAQAALWPGAPVTPPPG